MIMHPELEDGDWCTRARDHPVLGARQYRRTLISLTGDDADEPLPMVTKILVEALLQLVPREEIEAQLDQWFERRLAA